MRRALGPLLLTVSILLIIAGIAALTYVYFFAQTPADGITRFMAWLNAANGLLGLVNWYNYYHKKA